MRWLYSRNTPGRRVLASCPEIGRAVTTRVGLRERNKREKLRRIKAAAYSLFSEKGFDQTTVSEIARAARVGFGTCFSYARDKRDMLFLLFAEELADINDRPFRLIDRAQPLIEQLIAIFAPNYVLFAKNPVLSRLLLREWTFALSDRTYENSVPDRATYLQRLANLISNAQEDGYVTPVSSSELIAEMLYATYTGAVRQWLRADDPDAGEGVARLRAMFELQIAGMAPKKDRTPTASGR
jgi:AcrR family transcriptional regulator